MKKALVAFFGAALAVFGLNANAALDASVASGIASIQADATSLNSLIVPVVVVILGFVVVIKLIKRFGNKL